MLDNLRTLFGVLMLVVLSAVESVSATVSHAYHDILPADTLRVSLVTCDPGPDIYQIFGHTAVRVQRSGNNAFDLVFNYGTFSFTDDFVWKFTKGETDYMLAVYDFKHFIIDYVMRGSTVYEQELNLTHSQREQLFANLLVNARPENRAYRYNFLFDNCATRPRDMVEGVLRSEAEQVVYDDPDNLYTFREIVRHFGANYSWLTFGIDMAMGCDFDRTATWREHMFIPLYLKDAYDNASIVTEHNRADRDLVRETIVLHRADGVPLMPPTPWYITPMACALLLLMFTVVMTWIDMRRRSVSRWFDTIIGLLTFVSGLIIYFLVFFSQHPATTVNLNALWLTPLAIVPTVMQYVPKAVAVVRWYHIVNMLLLALFLILIVCGVQCVDNAVWPLVAVVALRSYNFVYCSKDKLKK